MMPQFSPGSGSKAPSARRLTWYGVFLVGTMVALWVVSRAVAMPSVDTESPPRAPDSTAATSSVEAKGTNHVTVFTWGNVAAFLLLAGGGAVALYLHQQKERNTPPTPFQRLGKLSLGPSKHVELVACGGEVLLLSVTEDNVALLKTYTQAAFEEEGGMKWEADTPFAGEKPSAATADQWSGSFADVLNRFADRTTHS